MIYEYRCYWLKVACLDHQPYKTDQQVINKRNNKHFKWVVRRAEAARAEIFISVHSGECKPIRALPPTGAASQ